LKKIILCFLPPPINSSNPVYFPPTFAALHADAAYKHSTVLHCCRVCMLRLLADPQGKRSAEYIVGQKVFCRALLRLAFRMMPALSCQPVLIDIGFSITAIFHLLNMQRIGVVLKDLSIFLIQLILEMKIHGL
jgi:hypothetical protein